MVLDIMGVYIVNHLIVGAVRGIYRYEVIRKRCYDYYETHPRSTVGKLLHHYDYVLFKPDTFYTSMLLTALEFTVFFFRKQIMN